MHVKIELTTTNPHDFNLIADLLKQVDKDEQPSGEYKGTKMPSKALKSALKEVEDDEGDDEPQPKKEGKKRGPYKKKDKEIASEDDEEDDEPKKKEKPKAAKAKAGEEDDDESESDEDDEEEEAPKKKLKGDKSESAFKVLKDFMNDAQKTGSEKKMDKAREHVAKVLKKFGLTNPRAITEDQDSDVIAYHEKLLAG